MKKIKHFSTGDKVFAKVKGYPAWPARVDEELGKKFRVFFYGTGETGIVKVEDLFSYVEHKDQFIKNLKRKDYNDAIEEIEAALKENGNGTSATEVAEKPKEEEKQNEEKIQPKRGIKRKSLTDEAVTEEEPGNNTSLEKHIEKKTKTDNETTGNKKKKQEPAELKEPKEDDTKINADTIEKETPKKKTGKTKKTNDNEEKEDEKVLTECERENNSDIKYIIVQVDQLQRTIDDCSRVISDIEGKEEANIPDNVTFTSNAILLTRVDYSKYIGLKVNISDPKYLKSAIERLQFTIDTAKKAIKLKEDVESNEIKPEDQPEHFDFNLQLSKEQQLHEVGLRIVERKKHKLQWLKIESSLVELDAMIKTSLGLDRADPMKALKYLDQMLELEIDPLMLKKHQHVVDMVKRLRRYIGNVREWKLKDKELTEFKEKADEIRKKAETVYAKFKKLFNVPDGVSFGEVFQQQVSKFKEETKNMSESEVFALCAEPGSKLARWDELDDQEEVKLMSEKNLRRNEMDKENINTASTETETPNETEADDNNG